MRTLLVFFFCLLSISLHGQGVAVRSISGQATNLVLKSHGGTNAVTVNTNKLVVTSAGNVGIGTDTPAAALHVVGDIIGSVVSSNAVSTTNAITSRQLSARFGDIFNVKDFGAKGDARKVTDGRTVGSDSNIFSMTMNFTARDVGKKAWAVQTATGLARLPIGTILAVVNSTNAIVSTNATTTLTGLSLIIGTDDTDAIRAAVTAASNITGRVYLPAGGYVFSKVLIQLEYSGTAETIAFEGDGAGKTFLFPSPAYDFTPIGLSYGLLHKCPNSQQLRLTGFTLDSSRYTFSNSVAAVAITGAHSWMRDVRVINHSSTGISLTSVNNVVEKCAAEGCASSGLFLNAAFATDIIGSYFGNNGTFGVDCFSIPGTNNSSGTVRFIGGLIDENTSTSCNIRNSSSDVSLIGTKIFGGQNAYAVVVDATSQAKFVATEITPYLAQAGHNRGGLRVSPGGIVWLTACRIDGLGSSNTWSWAITNAGTIYDGGNNVIGAGTIGLGVTNNGTILSSNIANVAISGSVSIRTNAIVSAPSGFGSLQNSNYALYWVTPTKTNLITDGL